MKPATAMTSRFPRRALAWGLVVVGAVLAVGLGVYWLRPRPDPDAIWRQAQRSLMAEKIGEAEIAVKQLARLRPPDDHDWMLRAQVAMARHRDDEAIADLGRIPDASPFAPQARLLVGQTELRRDRIRFAEDALLKAVKLDPKLVPARRELVYIYGMQTRRRELGEQMGALAELEPLTFQHIFLWCLTRGSVWGPDEILTYMTRYIKADPDDRWSRLAVADALEHMSRLDDAAQAIASLPDSDPDARAMRVRLAIDRGNMDEADRLLADGPQDHAVLARYRGKMDLRRRDGPAAVKDFSASDAAEPLNRDTIFGLSQALRMAGDEEAAARYTKLAHAHDAAGTLMQYAATVEAKSDPALPFKLGTAYEAVGRLPEARAWFQLCVDRNPLDAEAQQALRRIKLEIAQATAAK